MVLTCFDWELHGVSMGLDRFWLLLLGLSGNKVSKNPMAHHHFPRYNGNQIRGFLGVFFRGIRVFFRGQSRRRNRVFFHTKNDDLTNKKGEIFGIE